LNEILQRFGIGRLFTMAGIGLGLMVFFGYIMVRANQTEMALLYSQIEAAEGGRIIERLKTMGVPFEVKGDGTQIYAPADEVAKLRMELAQNGMPSGGGNVGYEIFDKQDVLGTTNALLGINQIRALEGEIGKSIQTIQGIQSARVHLVIPKRELFSEFKQEPSASVMVRLKGSSALSATQVQSIRYLVSSAVPSLILDHVSIVDDRGNLLARGKDSLKAEGAITTQQSAQREYEQRIARSIESLLDRTLGLNKTRAEVSVDMDFDQDGQVVKSQITSEEGANSNEHTPVGDSVSIQNSLPTKDPTQGNIEGSHNKNQSSNTEENTNYEISHSTKTYVKELGTIKRLSIAVMVDGSYKKKDDGTQEYQALPEEELKKLQELVKTATGYQEKRGDVITVVNLKFSELPQDSIEKNKEDLLSKLNININKLIEVGLTALIVLIGLFTVVRPLLSSLMKAIPSRYLTEKVLSSFIPNALNERQTVEKNHHPSTHTISNSNELEGPSGELLPTIEEIDEKVKKSSIKKTAELIDRHPEEAVSIIRSWIALDK